MYLKINKLALSTKKRLKMDVFFSSVGLNGENTHPVDAFFINSKMFPLGQTYVHLM